MIPINPNVPLITNISKVPEHNDTYARKNIEETKSNDRREIFQRIGQQEFEDVVFTPERKQKKYQNRIMDGNEDTLSSKTNHLSSDFDVIHANIDKTTTTHSSIMQLSFDDNFLLKSDRDLKTLQRDVENKEKLLADVLDFDLSKYMTNKRMDKNKLNIPTHMDDITQFNCNVHSNNIMNEEQNTYTNIESVESNDCTEIESGEEDVSYRTELKRLEDLGECRKILLQNKLDTVSLTDNNSVDIQQVLPMNQDELEYQFNSMYY